MEQQGEGKGRARGRGRGIYQHPVPFHAKDGHPGPQREPFNLASGPPRAPPPQPGPQPITLKHSSSEESQSVGRGTTAVQGSTERSTGSDPSKRGAYPGTRGDNLRGTVRPPRSFPDQIIYTRPQEITSKKGTSGNKITCQANYFRLEKKPDWNIYQYRVDFTPEVQAIKLRRYLVGLKRDILGGFLFDGTQLFLTKPIEGSTMEYVGKGSFDEQEYTVVIKMTGLVSMNESQSLQVLNLILRRAMDGLKLVDVGRNKYDPAAAISIPNLKLHIWPGYITSIRQHEEDILVCAELSSKVMRAETILDIIRGIRTEERDFKTAVEKQLLGATVLTKYNNKTYRIDEITYDVKPSDTFKMKDTEISYVDYYKQRYGLTIRDEKQPMLVSHMKSKDRRAGMSEDVLLVPELCNATGFTDEMRNNFRTMREMAQYTRIGPAARIDRLMAFNQRLRNTEDSMRQLKDWNLALSPELMEVPARVLPYPEIVFGNGKRPTNSQADWQREFRNSQMPHCIELKRWFVVVPARARREADDFIKALQRAGAGMRFVISNPRIEELPNDIQTAVSQKIQQCAGMNPQMIMCVVSNNQADRYATIKKRCYLDFGIPSQVMVHKTITPKDKSKGISGLMSVATKVAIQMNAKLGGLPWLIDVPVSGLMTVGYDVCHDPKDKSKSWGAMVATMDLKARNNEFFSAVNRHSAGEELSNSLVVNMAKALQQFLEINGVLPQRILFFRDGVGDGQIRFVVEHELVHLRKVIKEVYEKHQLDEPKFMYMIVTKRVNTRIFFDRKNPDPGTCVDDVITLPERYDFYLIPQAVNQGTVTPTGFNIIHDTFGLPPDRVQQLTFRFTYLYFNWSGTVRVPALCQYAHKLAFLASQSMQATPGGDAARKIERTLYYL